MRNKVLTITRKVIPYVKELRSIPQVKSVTSAILMQELDYLIDVKNPEPLYKFLQPCENAKYNIGDSWCEILGFSPDEFRTAFSNIGTKYNSYTEYKTVLDSGKCPFNGKLYLAYQDKLKGLTYYYRNDKLVDFFLDIIASGEPMPINLPTWAMPAPVDGQSQSTDMDNANPEDTKITTKNNTNTEEEKKKGEKKFENFESEIEAYEKGDIQFTQMSMKAQVEVEAKKRAEKQLQKQTENKAKLQTKTSIVPLPNTYSLIAEKITAEKQKTQYLALIEKLTTEWHKFCENRPNMPSTEKSKQITILCNYEIDFAIHRIETANEKSWGNIVFDDIQERYEKWIELNISEISEVSKQISTKKRFSKAEVKQGFTMEQYKEAANGWATNYLTNEKEYFAERDMSNDLFDARTIFFDKKYAPYFDVGTAIYHKASKEDKERYYNQQNS